MSKIRALIRRITALEQRMAPREIERVPRLPEWLVRLREEQGFPPIDELGRPDYAAMELIGAGQRAAAESTKAGTESLTPDLTQAIRARARFD